MGSKLTLAESIESEKANQEAKIYLRITKKQCISAHTKAAQHNLKIQTAGTTNRNTLSIEKIFNAVSLPFLLSLHFDPFFSVEGS